MIQIYPELAIDVDKTAKEIIEQISQSKLFKFTESLRNSEIVIKYVTKPLNIDYQCILTFNEFSPKAILEQITILFFDSNKWYKTERFGRKWLYDRSLLHKIFTQHSTASENKK